MAETIIFERCWRRELCVTNPLTGRRHCVDGGACVTLKESAGVVSIEIEAMGERARHQLFGACFPPLEAGVTTTKVCASGLIFEDGHLSSVHLTVDLCIKLVGIKKCWTVFDEVVQFARVSPADADALGALSLSADDADAFPDAQSLILHTEPRNAPLGIVGSAGVEDLFDGQIKNTSSKILWVVETDTGPAIAHKLAPGRKSPSDVDADGVKAVDGTAINDHSSWWKIKDGCVGTVKNSGAQLDLTTIPIPGSRVQENEFGNVDFKADDGWGVPL